MLAARNAKSDEVLVVDVIVNELDIGHFLYIVSEVGKGGTEYKKGREDQDGEKIYILRGTSLFTISW